MGKFIKSFVVNMAAVFFAVFLISVGVMMAGGQGLDIAGSAVKEDSILKLELNGVIIDGKTFIEDLKRYAKDDKIKGVLVHINSPGGVVGPSQEIYAELKRVRDVLQKPVVASCGSMAASGAYYAAVAADKIVTNPGTLVGSIGVIMEFANLEKLYSWAKIEPYVLKTGGFKDAGSPSRAMTAEERAYFQSVLDNVQDQFESAVTTNRKLADYIVDKYADGRVFTGEMAVKLGFADQIGTLSDAVRLIGELTNLGEDPKIFEPPQRSPSLSDFISGVRGQSPTGQIQSSFIGRLKLFGQPLFLMPGNLGL